jgi:hypothetical protein
MNRRIVAALLWVWCIATAWAFLAFFTGAPADLGPFVGLAVGAFVGMDPLHRIWVKPETAPASEAAHRASLPSLETDPA